MKEFAKLVRIMKKLRHPRRGCPWDLAQTPESLKEYILEEAHELIEAADRFFSAAGRGEKSIFRQGRDRDHQRKTGAPPSPHLWPGKGQRRR
jgi:NTP pyrophosphatase (non-canonical NTP hydrolase)